jgi:hypothetical protein
MAGVVLGVLATGLGFAAPAGRYDDRDRELHESRRWRLELRYSLGDDERSPGTDPVRGSRC